LATSEVPWPREWDGYIDRPNAIGRGLEQLLSLLRRFEEELGLLDLRKPTEEHLRKNGFIIVPAAAEVTHG